MRTIASAVRGPRELAEWLGATFEGDGERDLAGAAPLETAGASQLSFVGNRKAAAQAEASAAGCLIVPLDHVNTAGRTVIRAAQPRAAFARAVSRLHPPSSPPSGIHPTASVAADVQCGPEVAIGPMAVVGEGTRIGKGSVIGAGCVIGRRVQVGEACLFHANVTVYDDVDIGARVILHSGCVIGADGFGFVLEGDRYEKFPQVGRVSIGDDVEIGAHSCVDRAALGVTSIGEGTKLDNLVQIGHNCRIGRHVVVVSQTGLSGGVVVEDYAVIGGQVGIGDKARIESRAVLGSGCGMLTSKIVRAGQVVWGTPARPLDPQNKTGAKRAILDPRRSRSPAIGISRNRAGATQPDSSKRARRALCFWAPPPPAWHRFSSSEKTSFANPTASAKPPAGLPPAGNRSVARGMEKVGAELGRDRGCAGCHRSGRTAGLAGFPAAVSRRAAGMDQRRPGRICARAPVAPGFGYRNVIRNCKSPRGVKEASSVAP